MPSSINSVKRFAVILLLLVAIAISTILLYDLLIPMPINQPPSLRHSVRIILIIAFSAVSLVVILRSKTALTQYLGDEATRIVQFLLGTIAVLVMTLAVLHTLGVSPETLLLGAGIASVTIGLIISTFVGGVLSGALVFMTHRFKIGDTVLINNVPGKVTEITALATRVKTEAGQMIVPNSAVASGAVIVTRVHTHEPSPETRLPYALGDRVVTTYMQGEGTVKELTPIHSVILLDSGREIKFLNSAVLSGSVAVAKIIQDGKPTGQ